MKEKFRDFILWLSNPLEWQRRKAIDIINDYAAGVLEIFRQVAEELGEVQE